MQKDPGLAETPMTLQRSRSLPSPTEQERALPDSNERPSGILSKGESDDGIRKREKRQARSLTSGTVDTSQSGESSKRHRRFHKTVERLPFLRAPCRDNDKPWKKKHEEQSVWFALFYDLALVAVLTVFSGTHELTHPSAIPTFLSYFAILSWIWTSQCFYDIRYEANDIFHRITKSGQILGIIFIGAASGNWNLNTMKVPSGGICTAEDARSVASQHSFTTIVISFAISRGLLLFEYVVAMCLGVRCGRRVTPLLISSICVSLGAISLIIAAALPFETEQLLQTKIALVYLPLMLEIIGGWVQLRKTWHHQVSTESIGDRYGALTLVILGEGFISLTKAFSLAISGLSQKSTTTYAQTFLAIMIIVFTFLFLFARFSKDDKIHHSRVVIWEAVHFPLHFVLLLMLAAMVNFIVTLSFAQGLATVSTQFVPVLLSVQQNRSITESSTRDVQNYIAKLQLDPPFEQELDQVAVYNSVNPPTHDVVVYLDQYIGQILLQTIRSYGIEVSDEVFHLYTELQSLNTTIDYSVENVNETVTRNREHAEEIIFSMISEPANESLSGILWLFPCAGAVLLLAAIRSMVWYRFVGIAHWIIHAPMLSSGLALCLLGLLDLGSATVSVAGILSLGSAEYDQDGARSGPDQSPLITLVYESLPLAIVMIVYIGTYCISLAIMSCVQKKKGGVFANAQESRWIADERD